MILWGPPGTGKTTIARLLADAVGLRFVAISAVFSGVADLKKVFAEARERRAPASRPCCSWTRSTASTAPSRTASCPMSRTAPSPWSARPPRTRASSSTPRLLSRCQVLILNRLDHDALGELLDRAEALEGRPLPVTARRARR
jgi:putative ATPase